MELSKVTKSYCNHCQRAVYPGTHKFGCPSFIDHSTVVPTEPTVGEFARNLLGQTVKVIKKDHPLADLVAKVVGYDRQPMVSVHKGNLPSGDYIYLQLPKLPEYEGNAMAPILAEYVESVEAQINQAVVELTSP